MVQGYRAPVSHCTCSICLHNHQIQLVRLHFGQQPLLPAARRCRVIIKIAHDSVAQAFQLVMSLSGREPARRYALLDKPIAPVSASLDGQIPAQHGEMTARTIAIGDIHGCSQALRAIVEAIQPTADDTLVLLGDYVDRGPDSRGVMDFVLELEKRCRVVPLLGNHEMMLLDAHENPQVIGPWLECGGDATVRSYGGQLTNIPPEHLDFIRRCRRYYETPTHFFVHANYAADMPLDPAARLSAVLGASALSTCRRPHENGKIAIVGHTVAKERRSARPRPRHLHRHLLPRRRLADGAWKSAAGKLWQADREGDCG